MEKNSFYKIPDNKNLVCLVQIELQCMYVRIRSHCPTCNVLFLVCVLIDHSYSGYAVFELTSVLLICCLLELVLADLN